jgi:uncharacterized protein (TIGR02271 family)
MANTLVGVYENYNQAQSAMNALLDSGFSRSEVRISSEGAESRSMRTASASDQDTSGDTGVGGFFRSLFGLSDNDDDRRVSAYSEASERGHCIVTVDTADDDESERAMDVMNRFNPIDIDEEGVANTAYTDTGLTGTSTTGTAATSNNAQARAGGTLEGGASIPVIEEQLKVGKREVQRGGVRVYQRVSEKPVQESLNLREEHVNVERRPVDQPASAADLNAFEEKSFELRETSEEAVVSKTARVVEEVVINKDVTEHTETVNDTVRRTDVDVEQLGTTDTTRSGTMGDTTGSYGSTTGTTGTATGTPGTAGSNGPSVARTTGVSGTSAAATYDMDRDYSDYDKDYRSHWDTNYSNVSSTQGNYEDYAPAYRYGSEAAGSEQHRGRRFEEVEPQLRSDWESRNAGSTDNRSTWDKVKGQVRYGWDRITK